MFPNQGRGDGGQRPQNNNRRGGNGRGRGNQNPIHRGQPSNNNYNRPIQGEGSTGIQNNYANYPRQQRRQEQHGNQNQFNEEVLMGNRNDGPTERQGDASSTSNQRPKFDGPKFGFKKLFGFLTKDADEVIACIYRDLKEWDILLNQDTISTMKTLRNGREEMSDDILVILVTLLGEKIVSDCTVLSSKQIAIINSSASSQNFLTKIGEKCNRYMMQDGDGGGRRRNIANAMEVDQSSLRWFQNLNKIFHFVATKMQVTAVDFLSKLIPSAMGTVATIVYGGNPSQQEDWSKLLEDFKELKKELENMKKNYERQQEEKVKSRRRKYDLTENEEQELHQQKPPDDYKEMSIIPTIDELLSVDEIFLRPNKVRGAYMDADHYLDVQFRLLREDFVRPLKIGVQDYMKNKLDYLSNKKRPPIGNVRIYHEVRLTKFELVKGTMVQYVQLHLRNYQKVKWDKSKRLLNGSLLLFTPDDFNTAYFAVVHFREEKDLRQGIFGITWEGLRPRPNLGDTDDKYLMIESENYFEAYKHTLKILKEIELEDFPLSKFIVEASSDVQPPKYLLDNGHLMKIGRFECSPLQDSTWPTAGDLNFDTTQFEAFKACLTRQFAICQGPPGTGKTFLALQIVEVLLRNPLIWCPDESIGPILIVCYTNHALDSFLEGILSVFRKLELQPNMIRVGGRSKTEALDEFSLIRQRVIASKLRKFDNNYARMRAEAHRAVRDSEQKRAELMTELPALNNLQGIVDFDCLTVGDELQDEIPSQILETFKKPSWFGLDTDFDTSKLSNLERLRVWFPSNKQQQKPAAVVNPPPLIRPVQDEVDISDSDEEWYDVEELQENRVIEDIYIEAENDENRQGGAQNVGRTLKYLFNSVKNQKEQILSNLQAHKAQLANNKDIAPINRFIKQKEIDTKIIECQCELNVANRREEFLQTVLKAYKENMLQLPDIDRLVKNDFELLKAISPETMAKYASKAERWALFFFCLERAKYLTATKIKEANEKLIETQKALQEVFRYGDGQLIKKCKIVGMTTTGAAKYNDILRMAKSRIVIVEEAAEVLESHIVTCLTSACQHLILIGDHQQLRPSTTVYELSTQYKLDISLFERMVNNNLNCYKINTQHRMRPEIANLVVGTIYPELFNAPSVYLYPPVPGVLSNLFFISHTEAESSESDTKSKTNVHEAKFVTGLTRYLIQQGYTPLRITVLTTYLGQMFLIKQNMRKFPSCQGVRVTCVDNFQGEENDIIILSLVRSNDDGNIGFLKTSNRICVSLSRAKHGMFVIGNMTKLAAKSRTWKHILNKFSLRNEIGPTLPIECKIHGTINEVRTDLDFQRVAPEGGCLNPCEAQLKTCGHKCDKVCHIDDYEEHKKHRCKYPCEKSCDKGHPCKSKCFQVCPPCPVLVTKILPCRHEPTLACHVDEKTFICHQQVEKLLPCGHTETMACFVDAHSYKCKRKVVKKLGCGVHHKEMECHKDAYELTCKTIVTKELPCRHKQDEPCWKKAENVLCETQVVASYPLCDHKENMKCHLARKTDRKCRSKCTTRLVNCGHSCTLICHPIEDPNHINYECKKNCSRPCPTSGRDEHRCITTHKCYLPCPLCKKVVKRTLPCGHTREMPCNENIEHVWCQLPCAKKLGCGHDCKNECSEFCGPCEVPVLKKSTECNHEQLIPCGKIYTQSLCEFKTNPWKRSACGHDVKVPCKLARTLSPRECVAYCEHPCNFTFEPENGGCGHSCSGNASQCLHGRLHIKCQQVCGRSLVCGHQCKFPCSENCPPCQEQCLLTCSHSTCKATCGTPCIECTEPCTWRCVHKACTKLCSDICDREPCDIPCPEKLGCGHPCIGFCGEPCPPQCRICNIQELTEFMLYGNEEDEDARFILLEDCGHAIEHEGLDYYMNNEIEEGEITAKTCPRCKALIRRSQRYGNVLKKRLKDVMEVKKRKFGMTKQKEESQLNLIQRLKNSSEAFIHFPMMTQFLFSSLCNEVETRKGLPRIVSKKVDASSLASFDLMISHLLDAVIQVRVTSTLSNGQTISLKPEYKEDLIDRFTKLFEIIQQRRIPISLSEAQDFDREFHRIFDLKQAYLRISKIGGTIDQYPKAKPYFEQLMKIIDDPCRPYDTHNKQLVKVKLHTLETLLATGLGISDRERREILGALNLREGRWYKCPNGHYYVITECGGAMIESKCNECGSIIGGGSHRIRDDNHFGGEFDGASQPIWPQ